MEPRIYRTVIILLCIIIGQINGDEHDHKVSKKEAYSQGICGPFINNYEA